MDRRSFIGAILAAGIAPSLILTPGVLMPVRARNFMGPRWHRFVVNVGSIPYHAEYFESDDGITWIDRGLVRVENDGNIIRVHPTLMIPSKGETRIFATGRMPWE